MTLAGRTADPLRPNPCHERLEWMASRRDTRIIADDRVRHAALDSVRSSALPSIATITALLVLIPYEHEQSKTTHDPQMSNPKDCSAHVRSRWLFDRTTAVSPKHAEPFRFRMCLQRWRSASDAQPTCQSAGFNFQGHRTLSYIPPISSYSPSTS